MMFRFLAALILVHAGVGLSLGYCQAASHSKLTRDETRADEPTNPRLVDSYGNVNTEDAKARLDAFATELQNDPKAFGYIVGYGPAGEGSGTGTHIARLQKDYLADSRAIEADRIRTIYAGRCRKQTETLTELWLGSEGVAPTIVRESGEPEPTHGKFTERLGWDGLDDGEEAWGTVTAAAVADVLRRQPNDVVYLVVSNFTGSYLGTWRRVAQYEATDLQERGIKQERIKIIFGGLVKDRKGENYYATQARIQYWILPSEAAPPVKEAKPERTPKVAVRLGSYDDSALRSPRNERRVFSGFADLLRADAALTLCIIVRPRTPTAPDGETPVPSEEPPTVDPLKLVEKWRAELVEKLGVKANRLIVLPTVAGEDNEGTVEVWVVPPGVAFPDPYSSVDDSDSQDRR